MVGLIFIFRALRGSYCQYGLYYFFVFVSLESTEVIYFRCFPLIGIGSYVLAVLNLGYFSEIPIVLDAHCLLIVSAANIVQTFSLIAVIICVDSYYTCRGRQVVAFVKKTYSDFLLEKILPKYIIEKIKKGDKENVSEVSLASIIFLDIVGFTALSTKKKTQGNFRASQFFFPSVMN